MKIEINLKIILMIILLFLFNNLELYLMFFVFVLIHEIAHLCVGVLIGGHPKKLYINPFGVSLEIYYYGKNKSLNKILFYLIGPLINFIIAILFYYLPINIEIKDKIIYTNFAICFFNLLPILPLDGGKILKEILNMIVGIEFANNAMIGFSKIFLAIISMIYSVLILKIKNIYILILLIYLWYLFFMEERKYNILKKTVEGIKKYDKVLK